VDVIVLASKALWGVVETACSYDLLVGVEDGEGDVGSKDGDRSTSRRG
jgi:hypothetical protein